MQLGQHSGRGFEKTHQYQKWTKEVRNVHSGHSFLEMFNPQFHLQKDAKNCRFQKD